MHLHYSTPAAPLQGHECSLCRKALFGSWQPRPLLARGKLGAHGTDIHLSCSLGLLNWRFQQPHLLLHVRGRSAQCSASPADSDSAEAPPDSWEAWAESPNIPFLAQPSPVADPIDGAEASRPKWRGELGKLANNLRGDSVSAVVEEAEEVEFGPERAYLVGVHIKGTRDRFGYSTEESLEELARLAATAGLEVVGRAYQQLDSVNPRTYIGTGKLQELQAALLAVGAETIIFDDELTPGQLRNIEKVLGEKVRLCDRTALILDIFSQRAATKEGQLQVELAQSEYQLPRLTRMWSHLERQGGRGQVKGMGEKQIEVDKRLLRTRMATLRKLLDDVRAHRKQYRDRRAEAPVPVVALVGYTNAGKSTLLNRLTDAGVLAEDKLFATLDPTTRRVKLPSGKEVLFTDTVGFIQKLPTQLVAAFRATLEEISDASLLLHVVDVSHPNAAAQTQAVIKVLSELDVGAIPLVTVWNKVDACPEPEAVRQIAAGRDNTLCISAATGAGMAEFMGAVEQRIQNMMVAVEVLVPFAQGDLVGDIHRFGVIETEDYTADGTHIVARVPVLLATKLGPLAVSVVRQELSLAGHGGSRSKAVAEQDGWL